MRKKAEKKIEIGILIGYGDNCDCLKYGADCPVLYGAECDWRHAHSWVNASFGSENRKNGLLECTTCGETKKKKV